RREDLEDFQSGLDFILDIIKPRWVAEILYCLEEDSSSFSHLLEAIPFLNRTELNRKLHFLMERGVIIKSMENHRSSYRLTKLGKDLVHIFHHFVDLAEYHHKKMA
ncbi:MAG: winged helix-turn-helix transcriptional regulator, partial [Tissierellia bacterium]|nr:winged helix-turn-helix transcriptional regulator [Tissierellia bacterium]